MFDHIPEAVWIDILTRLTIEDLVRCIVVCKSWYSLITSPHFFSVHLNATTRSNHHLLLVRGSEKYDYGKENKEDYSIHLHKDNTFTLYKSLDFPFKSWGWNGHFRVVGCCNGVVCLSDNRISFTDIIILWNPSIKKSVTLPKPIVTFRSHGAYIHHAIGFGYNSATNDYKVVRVVYFDNYKVKVPDPPMAEVYEVSVGSWRSVDLKGFDGVITGSTSQVLLNGAVHWTGSNGRSVVGAEFMKIIVSFDLRTEDFAVMKMPDSVGPGGPGPLRFSSLSVSLLGESLALIHRSCRNTSVWVMKQYGVAESWTKQFSIDITVSLPKVCGVLKNEALLVVNVVQDWSNFRPIVSLVSYEPHSKQMNHIRDIQNKDSAFVVYFVETLALLGAKRKTIEPPKSENPAVSPDVHVKGENADEERSDDEEEIMKKMESL